MAEIIHRELFNENGEAVGYEYGGRLVRCKDCKYQRKIWHSDRRRKDGGYTMGFCNLCPDFTPLGYDDDYCSNGERREDGKVY